MHKAVWTRIGRVIRLLGAVMLPLVLLSNALPQLAHATTACQGYAVNFDGTDPKTMTTYGVRANIDVKLPALCGASYSSSSSWAMIAGGAARQYAQSGFVRWQGRSNVVTFAEYKKNSATPAVHKETTTPTGSPRYSTTYNFSTGRMTMFINDTTALLTTDFDPAVSWTPGWGPQWEGETHDPGDDVPGTGQSPEYFQFIQIIPSRGGAWTTPSGLTISSTNPRYSYAWNSASTFRIWVP